MNIGHENNRHDAVFAILIHGISYYNFQFNPPTPHKKKELNTSHKCWRPHTLVFVSLTTFPFLRVYHVIRECVTRRTLLSQRFYYLPHKLTYHTHTTPWCSPSLSLSLHYNFHDHHDDASCSRIRLINLQNQGNPSGQIAGANHT